MPHLQFVSCAGMPVNVFASIVSWVLLAKCFINVRQYVWPIAHMHLATASKLHFVVGMRMMALVARARCQLILWQDRLSVDDCLSKLQTAALAMQPAGFVGTPQACLFTRSVMHSVGMHKILLCNHTACPDLLHSLALRGDQVASCSQPDELYNYSCGVGAILGAGLASENSRAPPSPHSKRLVGPQAAGYSKAWQGCNSWSRL